MDIDPRLVKKANRLEALSKKFVSDDQLYDPPARLFRMLLRRVAGTPHKWRMYLRDYLDWIVTTENPERAKNERLTRQGNIKDTYFQKNNLSFNKMLEGMSILRMRSCEVILRVVDENGEIIELSDGPEQIVGKQRLSKPLTDPDKSED